MKNKTILYFVLLFITFLLVESCKTSQANTSKSTVSVDEAGANANVNTIAVEEKSGAQLWGENCVRCHNVPPPQAYSNGQWNVIGQHMRIRSNITQEKMEKIIAFIKSSN